MAREGGVDGLDLGVMWVRPHERIIESPSGKTSVEPLVMQLLLILGRRAGQLVTRDEIFAKCWGAAPVGNDSLNRLVAVLRKALNQVAGSNVAVETVPSAGYVLRLASPAGDTALSAEVAVNRAVEGAFDSWRLGLPEPDHPRLEMARIACRLQPRSAIAWSSLALLCRQASEYAEPAAAAGYVAECEGAARAALALEPGQVRALAALAGVAPLFGRWLEARAQLIEIVRRAALDPVPTHDLAVVEMATGRVRAAKKLMDGLIAGDPLAACFAYKSVYHNWTVGNHIAMDQLADRAIQLWPTHPAVWTARLWTLAYSGRAAAALDMLGDAAARPDVPPAMLGFLRTVMGAAVSNRGDAAGAVVEASIKLVASGPAQAIASLFALGLLGTEEVLDAAESYYLRDGKYPAPMQHSAHELSINDQHRRVTQILFTPAFEQVRTSTRFLSLCDRIGLTRYWETSGLPPDFAA